MQHFPLLQRCNNTLPLLALKHYGCRHVIDSFRELKHSNGLSSCADERHLDGLFSSLAGKLLRKKNGLEVLGLVSEMPSSSQALSCLPQWNEMNDLIILIASFHAQSVTNSVVCCIAELAIPSVINHLTVQEVHAKTSHHSVSV